MTDRFMRLTLVALFCGAAMGTAQAQEVFSSGEHSSNRTGTQGVVGNPNCAPPVEIINGRRITPLNWSCDSSGYWASRAPNIKVPSGAPHPGPAYEPGAGDPCRPYGPGGYNWLANPVGTRLPPGCVRPARRNFTVAKRDSHYESLSSGSHLALPVGPPGSYIERDSRPGDYIVPPQGAPGSYLQQDGRPGSYLDSTAESDPGGSNGLTHTNPRGAATRSSATDQKANKQPVRRNMAAMQGESFAAGSQSYRQDTGAMQIGLSDGRPRQKPVKATRAKNMPKKSNNTAATAANARAARTVNGIINLFRNGP